MKSLAKLAILILVMTTTIFASCDQNDSFDDELESNLVEIKTVEGKVIGILNIETLTIETSTFRNQESIEEDRGYIGVTCDNGAGQVMVEFDTGFYLIDRRNGVSVTYYDPITAAFWVSTNC